MINTKSNRDSAADAVRAHRNAYNAAFYELGLSWHWDDDIYQTMLCEVDERARLRIYLETQQPHLLKTYDADFLIDTIQMKKASCYDRMSADSSGIVAYINWSEIQQREVGF